MGDEKYLKTNTEEFQNESVFEQVPGNPDTTVELTPAQELEKLFAVQAQARDTVGHIDSQSDNPDADVADLVDGAIEAGDVRAGAMLAVEEMSQVGIQGETAHVAVNKVPTWAMGEALAVREENSSGTGGDPMDDISDSLRKTDIDKSVVPAGPLDQQVNSPETPEGSEFRSYETEDANGFVRRVYEVPGQPERKLSFADQKSGDLLVDGIEVIPANVQGVIELAQSMAPDGMREMLRNLQEGISNRRIGKNELAVFDMISAAITPHAEPDDSDPSLKSQVPDGLMLAACALAGDDRALGEVRSKMEWLIQNQMDSAGGLIGRYAVTAPLAIRESSSEGIGFPVIEGNSGVGDEILQKAEGMYLIRRTENYKQGESSAVEFYSPSTLTHGADQPAYRDTIHWSINNLTLPHGFGVVPRGDVIITPLASALKSNGCPEGFSATDVVYTTNPEQNMSLPDSIIIGYGEVPDDTVFLDAGERVDIRTTGYTEELVSNFAVQLSRMNHAYRAKDVEKKIIQYCASYCSRTVGEVDYNKFEVDEGSGVFGAVSRMYDSVSKQGEGGVSLDIVLRESIMRLLVESKVTGGGGEVLDIEGSGAYALDDNKTTRSIEEIAINLGVPRVSHGNMSESKIEIAIGNYLSTVNLQTEGAVTDGARLVQALATAHPYKILRNMIYNYTLPVSFKQSGQGRTAESTLEDDFI